MQSNRERCEKYLISKTTKGKIDDLLSEYTQYKEKRRKVLKENEEDICYNYEQVQGDENEINNDASSCTTNTDYYALFKKKRLQEAVSLRNTSNSEFDSKLEQWFSVTNCNSKVIPKVQIWVVNSGVPYVQVDKILNIIQAELLPSMPKCTKTLLKCNVTFDIQSMNGSNRPNGEFYYFGIRKKLEKTIVADSHESNTLELIVFIDGLSPFRSSSANIWPVLCKVYTQEDRYKPFTVAIFAGEGKPQDPAEYMSDFIFEMNEFQDSRIIINNRTFEVRIKYFICDTPARSYVKCNPGHTAFVACERCKVLGQKADKVTVFLDSNAEPITDASFRSFEDPDRHKGVSALTLIEPPIDMVKQFVLDPMHLLYLGVTKRVMEYLLQSKSKHKARISEVMKTELQRRTKLINKDIPQEFQRKMRHSGDYGKYKAVEFKFFALYAAPVVLKELLSNAVYDHLMLFTCACRLMSYQDPLPHIQTAREYFKRFVDGAPKIYGSSFVSLNVHNLIHLCDDVESTGCNFNELSAFCFESYLGSISRSLRSPKHLLAQYCRREHEKDTYGIKSSTPCLEPEVLMQQRGKVIKLQYKEMILSTTHPNHTILLEDSSVAEISQFHMDDQGIKVEIHKFTRKESFFKSPCDSGLLNFWEVSRKSAIALVVPLEKVVQKCVKFQMNLSTTDEQRLYIIPLLHTHQLEASD